MPGSNTTGGKRHKKKKKHIPMDDIKMDARIETAGVDQIYATVKRKAGGSRIIVDCSDSIERSAIIPGKFFKKIWLNPGDILLCGLNVGGNDSICYIIHKYTNREANVLKSLGKITFDILEEKEESETTGYKYVENEKMENKPNTENKSELLIRNPNKKQNISILDADSSEESIDKNTNKNNTEESSNESIDLDNL